MVRGIVIYRPNSALASSQRYCGTGDCLEAVQCLGEVDPDGLRPLDRRHLSPFSVGDEVDGSHAEAGRENVVAGGGRAASLDVCPRIELRVSMPVTRCIAAVRYLPMPPRRRGVGLGAETRDDRVAALGDESPVDPEERRPQPAAAVPEADELVAVRL